MGSETKPKFDDATKMHERFKNGFTDNYFDNENILKAQLGL